MYDNASRRWALRRTLDYSRNVSANVLWWIKCGGIRRLLWMNLAGSKRQLWPKGTESVNLFKKAVNRYLFICFFLFFWKGIEYKIGWWECSTSTVDGIHLTCPLQHVVLEYFLKWCTETKQIRINPGVIELA